MDKMTVFFVKHKHVGITNYQLFGTLEEAVTRVQELVELSDTHYLMEVDTNIKHRTVSGINQLNTILEMLNQEIKVEEEEETEQYLNMFLSIEENLPVLKVRLDGGQRSWLN